MKLPSLTNFASVFAICAFGSALPANAAALIYESFSFATDGTKVAGNTADTGLGVWANTGNTQPSAADLGYGDLVTGGGSAKVAALWGRPRAAITADMTSLLADGGEMWFSLRLTTSSGDLARVGLAIGDSALGTNGVLDNESGNSTDQALGGFLSRNTATFHSLVWEQNTVSTNNFQGTSPTETIASTITLNAGNSFSALIVGHVQWGADASANDILTLYAPGAGSLGTPGSVRAVSEGVVSQQSFDTLSLATGGTNTFYDEIRFGASFADVVPTIPEPTTALLGGLGWLMLLRRRRN